MGIKCPKCHFENPDDTLYCGKCATPLPTEKISAPTETLEAAKEELSTGSTFAGRYQIIEELGKGGMGKVYKAHDTEIKEKVALKLLKPEIAADKKTIERFQNELKFARKISHRNVCRMYDLNKEEGSYYITMEYVPGEDLKSTIIRIGQFPIAKTISIAKQVCEGLEEAHRLDVVHRDLKPQNIMIDKEGNVRIMDFGIARSVTGKGITGAGVMIGTPEYMSPEQVEGKDVDQRSDIYSLGVILYEMVTGRVPFEGDTPLSIAVKHKTETPKEPRELNSQIPEDLSRVILRCMEKDKEKRYQMAGEVWSELENIEKGIPTTERIVTKRKPITSREITVTFSLKKLFIPALVVIALVIIGVIIWRLLPKKEVFPIPSDKPSIAILFFENISSNESLEGWRTGLSELLITDLNQSKFLNVLSSDRIFSILKKQNLLDAKKYSSEDLAEVAEEGRVSHIVKGGLIKADENIIITATLHNTQTGEIISSKRLECKSENEIFSRVDELTKEIKLALNISSEQIMNDIDKTIGQITTSSPEAYKYYLEGRKIFEDDYHKSISFTKRATEIDPEFAMAYRSMAMAYRNMGYGSEAKKYHKKAFELSDRVSDREKYQIQGAFYWDSEETFDKAIEAYSKLLQLYPDDGTGNLNLGGVYRDLEQWDKAIKQFEIDRRISPESLYSYANLTFIFGDRGMYDESREILDEYLENFSDNAQIRWLSAWNYLYQGNYKLALAEADKGMFLNPSYYRNMVVKGNIHLCDEEFIKSEKEYLKLLELDEEAAQRIGRNSLGGLYLSQGKFVKSKNQLKQGVELARKLEEKEWEPDFHLNLARMNLKTGNLEDALSEVEKAWAGSFDISSTISTQIRALHLKGLIYLEMRSIDQAQKSADQLRESIENWINKKLMRYYYHLQGKIELKRTNYSGAIELFKKALTLSSYQGYQSQEQALFIDSLALSYYKAADLENAREEYEKITTLITSRLSYGDIYAKSFYMLGKIYEEQGNTAKAIEHYEKFLSLWKDADPGIAEVEDAKKRLAGLKES